MAIATTLLSFSSYSQIYVIGTAITPNTSELELFSTSSTNVSYYRYKKPITIFMNDRKVADIVVGIKNGYITVTTYLIIPKSSDLGVPKDIVNTVQEVISLPLGYHDGKYGANIDNMVVMLSRDSSTLTFNKDRIVYLMRIK